MILRAVPFISFGLVAALAACAAPPVQQAAVAPVISRPVAVAPPAPALRVTDASSTLTGLASWYRTGRRLHRTYSGQMLNNHSLTAASSDLPMGTLVRVGRLDDGNSVVVRVNDRMPHNHRLIDLSEMAAKDLGLMGCGVTTVTVTPIVVASAP